MPENGLSKGKAQPAKNGQKGKGKSATGQKRTKGKRESWPRLDFASRTPQFQKVPSRTQLRTHARTHARTNETKRFPGWGRWRSNPPNLRYYVIYTILYTVYHTVYIDLSSVSNEYYISDRHRFRTCFDDNLCGCLI